MKDMRRQVIKKCSKEMKEFFGGFVPDRLGCDLDFVGLISGNEGSGKSTLAIEASYLIDPDFDITKNVLYSPDAFELSSMVLDFKKGSAIDADEAINILYKYEFNTKMQRALSKLYATCRKRNLASLFCMPDFIDLTKFFRRRTHAWIHVIDRGRAVVLIKNPNFVSGDRWGIKHLDRKFMKYFGSRRKYASADANDILDVLRQSSNYLFEFDFPKLPDELFAQYSKLSLEAGKEFEIQNETKGKVELYKDALGSTVELMYKDHGYTQSRLANITGFSIYTINDLLRRRGARNLDIRVKNL